MLQTLRREIAPHLWASLLDQNQQHLAHFHDSHRQALKAAPQILSPKIHLSYDTYPHAQLAFDAVSHFRCLFV